MPLNEKQRRFVAEYLVDLNATQAAIRAGYSAKTAYSIGDENLRKPEIAAAIADAQAERSKRTEITQDMVLQRWWQIATANPNDLIQFRRTCCRFCFGVDHHFQWRDEAEWMRAVVSAQAKATEDKPPQLPSNAGGYGFDKIADPNPDCPECRGEGTPDAHVLDTRKLSSQAMALYAGVKVTKDGLEVKMQDQGAALANVAKHLGMFKERLEHTGPDGTPFRVEVVRFSASD